MAEKTLTPAKYIASLDKKDKDIISKLRKIIVASDKSVKEKIGGVMGSKTSLVYLQEDVFKYCLAVNKNYYSFHSLAMYANPALHKMAKENFKAAKLQKGCINFNSLEQFEPGKFEKFMKASAKTDFTPVINYYKSKKK
jgi:hypothetical protein